MLRNTTQLPHLWRQRPATSSRRSLHRNLLLPDIDGHPCSRKRPLMPAMLATSPGMGARRSGSQTQLPRLPTPWKLRVWRRPWRSPLVLFRLRQLLLWLVQLPRCHWRDFRTRQLRGNPSRKPKAKSSKCTNLRLDHCPRPDKPGSPAARSMTLKTCHRPRRWRPSNGRVPWMNLTKQRRSPTQPRLRTRKRRRDIAKRQATRQRMRAARANATRPLRVRYRREEGSGSEANQLAPTGRTSRQLRYRRLPQRPLPPLLRPRS